MRLHRHLPQFTKAHKAKHWHRAGNFAGRQIKREDGPADTRIGWRPHGIAKHVAPTPEMIKRAAARARLYMHSAARRRAESE
jgi:hypothetical protein